jgi:hypothetical protein
VSRAWISRLVFLAVLALLAGGVYWAIRPREIPTTPPSGAPKVGSCWTVDEAAAHNAFPWSGSPVDCAQPHTMEVFHVGQVDHALIREKDSKEGQNAAIAQSLMYAQARRACLVIASQYLGSAWRAGRVQVVANWINPTENGFYGCALAEVRDPAGKALVSRQASLRGTLTDGYGAPIAINCVSRAGGDALQFAGCDGPHDGEYVGLYTVTPLDAPYDEKAVKNTATRGCTQLALNYLGLAGDAGRADLRTGYVGPGSKDDWLGSDQTYACYLMVNEGKIRGSLRGLGARPLPR